MNFQSRLIYTKVVRVGVPPVHPALVHTSEGASYSMRTGVWARGRFMADRFLQLLKTLHLRQLQEHTSYHPTLWGEMGRTEGDHDFIFPLLLMLLSCPARRFLSVRTYGFDKSLSRCLLSQLVRSVSGGTVRIL